MMKKLTAILLLVCMLFACGVALASTDAYVIADRISTRSGPGTSYTEPGSFLRTGMEVVVHTKVYDAMNEIYWVQVEFTSGGERYRAYTGDWRLSVDLSYVPYEVVECSSTWLTYATCGYAGPGYQYHYYDDIQLYRNSSCQIIEVENDFALIDTFGSSQGHTRVWVPLSCLYDGYRYFGVDTFTGHYPFDGDQGATLLPGDDDDQGAILLPGYGMNAIIGRSCVVWVDSGHARSGPGTGYQLVATVEFGDVLNILDYEMGSTGKDWYQVRINGRLCWLSSGLVMLDGNAEGTAYGMPIPTENPLADYPLTSTYLVGRWFRVDTSSAHVRQKPDTASPTVGYVKEYQQYLILECRVGSTGKTWYMIKVDDKFGWISSGLGTVVQ